MSETDQTTSQLIEPETAAGEKLEKGIDVSNWQGKIDWNKVANAGIKHVCIKMTEGSSFVDKSFVSNWKGAKKANIKVNCYHYFRALGCSPEDQMKNIKKNLKEVDFDPKKNNLCIDVEKTNNENASKEKMAENLMNLLKLIGSDNDLKNCTPMIYTSSGYWNDSVKWSGYEFGKYPLWVAHYETKTPRIPDSWKEWTWWQYSCKGRVNGIAGDVDLDWIKI